MIIDNDKKIIEYTNAGHPYPFIIDSSGGSRIVDYNETLLGITDCKYTANTLILNDGDTIYLYSDGIVEMTADNIDAGNFDISGLTEFLCARRDADKSLVFSELYKKLIEFYGSEDFEDDIMLLSVALRSKT